MAKCPATRKDLPRSSISYRQRDVWVSLLTTFRRGLQVGRAVASFDGQKNMGFRLILSFLLHIGFNI